MSDTIDLRRAAVQGLVALVAVLSLVGAVAALAGPTTSRSSQTGAPPAVQPTAETALPTPVAVPTLTSDAAPTTALTARTSRAQARLDAQARRLEAGPLTPAAALRGPSRAAEALAQRRDRLLRQVAYPWRDLGWTVELVGPRPGFQGLADPATRTISVFVRSGQSDLDLLKVLAHELGHAVDLAYGTPARRAEWRQLRGLPASTSWFPCAYCPDYASGAGDFAEAFAVYLVGRYDYRSQVAPAPGDRALFDLGYLFWP